ncbi:hypothetical protein JZ751_014338, partial [Albula glossodonta]
MGIQTYASNPLLLTVLSFWCLSVFVRVATVMGSVSQTLGCLVAPSGSPLTLNCSLQSPKEAERIRVKWKHCPDPPHLTARQECHEFSIIMATENNSSSTRERHYEEKGLVLWVSGFMASSLTLVNPGLNDSGWYLCSFTIEIPFLRDLYGNWTEVVIEPYSTPALVMMDRVAWWVWVVVGVSAAAVTALIVVLGVLNRRRKTWRAEHPVYANIILKHKRRHATQTCQHKRKQLEALKNHVQDASRPWSKFYHQLPDHIHSAGEAGRVCLKESHYCGMELLYLWRPCTNLPLLPLQLLGNDIVRWEKRPGSCKFGSLDLYAVMCYSPVRMICGQWRPSGMSRAEAILGATMRTLVLLAAVVALVCADSKVYFREQFEDGDAWKTRWVESKHKSDYGKFVLTSGKFYGDAEKDKGLQTSQDARFYSASARFDSFSNEGQPLVVQFTVKHEQTIDCGGGYIKLFPADLNQEDMHGDSTYNIMFGPDICGPGTKKVHVIFSYRGKNHLINKDIRCKDDEYTHLYTLIVNPDNTYVVKIDNKKVESGSLEEDWDILPPKKIKDPDAKKPDDWDEREKVDDPDDKKPEASFCVPSIPDWDKPEHIPDPDAKKPEDWDDEMDGEWEPPMITNPEYKGEWKPRQIDNPNYKGKWVHPEIDNPEYTPDSEIYKYDSMGVIGLDLWQVKSGTIFDNFLITNDPKLAEEVGNETWGLTK